MSLYDDETVSFAARMRARRGIKAWPIEREVTSAVLTSCDLGGFANGGIAGATRSTIALLEGLELAGCPEPSWIRFYAVMPEDPVSLMIQWRGLAAAPWLFWANECCGDMVLYPSVSAPAIKKWRPPQHGREEASDGGLVSELVRERGRLAGILVQACYDGFSKALKIEDDQ